jgi:hypothetical protein
VAGGWEIGQWIVGGREDEEEEVVGDYNDVVEYIHAHTE